jgi:hypothetical protein
VDTVEDMDRVDWAPDHWGPMVGLERTVQDFHIVAGRFAADILRHPLQVCFALYVPWASSFAHGGHQCVGQHCH